MRRPGASEPTSRPESASSGLGELLIPTGSDISSPAADTSLSRCWTERRHAARRRTGGSSSCLGWPTQLLLILLLIVSSFLTAEAPRPLKPRFASVEDLRQGGISKREEQMRAAAVERFCKWLELLDPRPLEWMARKTPVSLSENLEEYLYQLFSTRWSHNEGRQLLLGVGDRHSWMRSQLSGPWRILRNWQRLEPPCHRLPIPVVWFRGLVVTALCWGWKSLVLCLLLGYFGLLRPAEICGLTRADILLPLEHSMGRFLLVRIGEPKSRWAAAHQQYVRVGSLAPISWMSQELSELTMESRLWPASPSTFATRLSHLSRAIVGSDSMIKPSGLRTGGATYEFQSSSEDLQRLQWRGRWRDPRMLLLYIQELSAASVRMRLDAATTAFVNELASHFHVLMGMPIESADHGG